MQTPLDRFYRYIALDTASSEDSDATPSTQSQIQLANLLVEELRQLGLENVQVDDKCYVVATLPTNQTRPQHEVPVVGLIAHMDVSCAAPAANIKPRAITYSGGDITLENGVVIVATEEMKKLVGHELIVTDGTTLLGADDKAGIAAIMTALERLIQSNDPRPTIRVCFTPDEEIGRGADHFDVQKFDADCAYTVDGGPGGEINAETFTADYAVLTVNGVDVHPGEAKDTMINASRVLAQIISALPLDRTPENTEGRQPFIHLYKMSGGVSKASAEFLLRAFDEKDRAENKAILERAVDAAMTPLCDVATSELTVTQQYLNMGYFLKDAPEPLLALEQAVKNVGLQPVWIAIRGGTDGSRLTEMGLPTPNIFTGGRNFHSVMEFLDVQENELATQTLVELAKIWATKKPLRNKD
ncbi:MAG: peptidase T [Planctomycetia bacterium]|nr:peptidase T [Planctomycetia bacterium]